MISSCRAKMRCHPRSHLAWQNEDLISVVVVYYAMLIPGSCSDITWRSKPFGAAWIVDLLSRYFLGPREAPLQIRRSGDHRGETSKSLVFHRGYPKGTAPEQIIHRSAHAMAPHRFVDHDCWNLGIEIQQTIGVSIAKTPKDVRLKLHDCPSSPCSLFISVLFISCMTKFLGRLAAPSSDIQYHVVNPMP